MRWRGLAALAITVAVGCTGLRDAGWYLRAGWAEARLLLRREPIAALLADPALAPGLRARLELTLAVRRFAAEHLGLDVGESFTTFARVGDDAVVHVLSAARRDRLAAYQWWYPIVGPLPYRGFFDEAAAAAAARRLGTEGLDTIVRPAVAFSTLGWFADPLLSTTAAEPTVVVVDTVLHELFHATAFRRGAATFNESAATFVGGRGAIAYLCRPGRDLDAPACAGARRRWHVTRDRGDLLERLASRLGRLYARRLPPARRERARVALARAVADRLEARGLGVRADVVPPNNARLLGELVYLTGLGTLERLADRAPDLRDTVALLVQAATDDREPFAALRALASAEKKR